MNNTKSKIMSIINKNNNITAIVYIAITLAFGIGTLHSQTNLAVDNQGEVAYTSGAVATIGSIRLIDNLGTVKFLQSSNGITTITNNSGGDLTTTTLQLGGTLTDATYIDVNGNVFAIDGINITGASPSTNAVSGDDAKGGTPTGSGYTLLVRNEGTGAIEKLLLSALDIVGGQQIFDSTSTPAVSNATADYPITGAGTLEIEKTFVYRNGVKLLATRHYDVKAPASGTDYIVEIKSPVLNLLRTTDVLEVHFTK